MRKRRHKKGTTTSRFGVSERRSHDSSEFYTRKLFEDFQNEQPTPYVENPIPSDHLDKIFCRSSEHMSELPDCSVHLMVTSPPYDCGKEYDEDLGFTEYRSLLQRVFRETWRVLVPGGRTCINVANLGRKPYIPMHHYVMEDALKIGFLMRGEVIWNKNSGGLSSTAWGSWRSATNPTLRDMHEYILVFSKQRFGRKKPKGRVDTISRDNFLSWTQSVWTFQPESAKRVGHPAPFPEELPTRLIELFTFKGDVVLDPFIGSGTTAVAAIKLGRHYVGYDVNSHYVELARKRIDKEVKQQRLSPEAIHELPPMSGGRTGDQLIPRRRSFRRRRSKKQTKTIELDQFD